MSRAVLHRFEVADPMHGGVPCAALVPSDARGLPLCLFLYGGGGNRESLAQIQPLLESYWAAGTLAPMLIATPDVGPWSFYLDDPARGLGWESFIAERLIAQLRRSFPLSSAAAATGLVGVSMGGYGALKLALSRPDAFGAVSAISPMIEPAFEASDVRLRNRYHYPPEVPQALLGPERDAELYRNDHPAGRARQHAAALRAAELGIYIDAAGRDALNAHDGAEHLHRVLWDLDIAHEYRLRQDSDHAGPDFLVRLFDAFAWVSARISPAATPPLTAAEHDWQTWLAGDRAAAAPAPLPPTSRLFPQLLRAQLEPLRQAAEQRDPTLSRRNGLLPPTIPDNDQSKAHARTRSTLQK